MKNHCLLNKLRRAGVDLEAGQKMVPIEAHPLPDRINTEQITKKKTRKKRMYFGNAQGKGKLFGLKKARKRKPPKTRNLSSKEVKTAKKMAADKHFHERMCSR